MKYLFDLDGVLCSQREDGDYEHADPIWSHIDRVNTLHEAGHTVHVWTARGAETGIDWEAVTRRQLDRWGLKYDRLIMGVKPHADVYVDDRGMRPEEIFGPAWEAM